MIILSDLLDDVYKVFDKFDLDEKIQLTTSSNEEYDFQKIESGFHGRLNYGIDPRAHKDID